MLKRLVKAIPGYLDGVLQQDNQILETIAGIQDEIWKSEKDKEAGWERAMNVCFYSLHEAGQKEILK